MQCPPFSENVKKYILRERIEESLLVYKTLTLENRKETIKSRVNIFSEGIKCLLKP